MSRQKILINNVTYIRSRDAAPIVHLAPDYVSRLARAELIAGHQVDGLWFVNLASHRFGCPSRVLTKHPHVEPFGVEHAGDTAWHRIVKCVAGDVDYNASP